MPYYQYRYSFGSGWTPIVKNLMIIMGGVFLLQEILQMMRMGIYFSFLEYFALIPGLIWNKYRLWQLVTYIFLHGDFGHIIFNLLALWMFGGELESYWGSRKFLRYFLFCGIGAGLCTAVFSLNPVIGASGALYGILLAFGWLFPNRLIYIYFLFPVPAKYMVVIFGLLEFFYFSRPGTGGGISHLTHLGGLLFGLIYMGYPVIRQKIRREYYRRKWSQRGPDNKNYYS